MARNGSGTMTPSVDFTTEAASPPIEISKLDTALDDVAAEITNSIAADGQTNPTANLKMNGFKHTNVAAATALSEYGRVSEIIDQDHIYYVDSGSANTLQITPSPAIAAYEEGQRFVVRAAANNSGATTLNVNSLGAIAVQTADGVALASGAILIGGIYEFTYDANTTPDRWVLTSMPSDLPDGMLSTNVPLKNGANTFTASASASTPPIRVGTTSDSFASGVAPLVGVAAAGAAAVAVRDESNNIELFLQAGTGAVALGSATNHDVIVYANNAAHTTFESDGTITTPGVSAAEVGYQGMPVDLIVSDTTLALTSRGHLLVVSSAACNTITIPANASVAFPIGSVIGILVGNIGDTVQLAITSDSLTLSGAGTTGTRTLAANSECYIKKITATAWYVSGVGIS